MREIAVPVSVAGGLPPRPPAHHTRRSLGGETMGTTWQVQLYAARDRLDADLYRLISRELDRLVREMSHWQADSDLSRFNCAPAGHWVDVPPELFAVLAASVQVAALTGGAFDATVGPLVDAWGFGPARLEAYTPPSEVAICDGVRRRGSDRVRFDHGQSRVLQPGDVSFDLSSIAKGFAVDRIVQLLDLPDISSCLFEIGGELRARGVKANGEPWWVAVESPPDAAAFPELVIALCNLAIASSGDYRRYFEHQGQLYSHTIDPRTGHSVAHGIVSVTALHEQCMLADAYSTALAVMGPQEGLRFANHIHLAAQFVVRDKGSFEVRRSERLAEMLDS